MFAFIGELIGRGCDHWKVCLGGGATMELKATLMRIRMPVSYSEDSAHIPADDEEEESEWDDQEEEPLQ